PDCDFADSRVSAVSPAELTDPSLPRSRETAEVRWFTAEGVIVDPGARVIGGASRCGDRQWRGVAVVGSAVSRRPLAASVAADVQRRRQTCDRLRMRARP